MAIRQQSAPAGPSPLMDGFGALNRGVNSGIDYSLLPRNQAAFMVNGTVRGGYPTCRPGLDKTALDIPEELIAASTGLWQGSSPFVLEGSNPEVIFSISGHLYSVDTITFKVRDITPVGDPNTPYLTLTWFVQAENWLVIQNNLDRPIIYDGSTSYRAGPKQVPVGGPMRYVNGRIWVAVGLQLRQFIAGDIAGGSSGTDALRLNAVLNFTENTYWNEGGAFSVPVQSGPITGFAEIVNVTGAVGTGSLFVCTGKGVFPVDAPIDRTTWKDLTDPIIKTSVVRYGPKNQFGIVSSNGDIWYRSNDGIRTIISGLRNFGTWGNTPQSNEISRTLKKDDGRLLKYGSGALFDNRLFMTATPQRDHAGGTYHLGLVVADFDLISTMQAKEPPVWEGIWTGLKFLQILTVETTTTEQCFTFTRNSAGKLELWELSYDSKFDNGSIRIQWSIESPVLDFAASRLSTPVSRPLDLKQLTGGDIWIKNLIGQADINTQYKTDDYEGWIEWGNTTMCASKEDCTQNECGHIFQDVQPQYRPRINLPVPDSGCEPANNKQLREFHKMGARLNITGYCTITNFRAFANPIPEVGPGLCQEDGACILQAFCKSNPYSYVSS